jgi:CBS domain-containing protein
MTAKREERCMLFLAIFRPFVANNTAVLNYLLKFATNKPSSKDNENSREV